MKKLLYILMFLITFLSNILLTLYIWINNIFGAVNFENIMFTIATPMKGTASDQEIISSFILNVIILSFTLTILLFIPFILYHYRVKIHTLLRKYIYIYIYTYVK